METNRPFQIVLVDDHPLMRMGTVLSLQKSEKYQVIAEAENAADFYNIFNNNPPIIDLVLLDIILPDASGVDLAKFLRANYPDIKILVLSIDSSKSTILQLFEIGINGFISKNASVDELLSAIDSVLSDMEFYGKDVAQLIYDIKTACVVEDDLFTNRELEIIKYCAEGLYAKEIAKQLNISTRTVETHKNNIFKKLGFSSSVELVKYAFEHSLII